MLNPNVLYRLATQQANGLDVMTAAELVHSVCVREPAAKPSDPRLPSEEWYCETPSCPVREVRIDLTYLDGPAPKKRSDMRCPGCGYAMKFHHYLEDFTLVPVGEQKGSSA